MKHQKEELSLVQLGSHIRIEESLRVQDSDKIKGKTDVGQPSVHMVEVNKNNQNHKGKGTKRKFDNKPNKPNKKPKDLVCWRCHKTGHVKRDCRVNLNRNVVVNNGAGNSNGSNGPTPPREGQISSILNNSAQNYCSLIPESFYVQDDDCTWWVDSGATSHMCKDRRWFEKLTPVDDGYTVMMGDDSSQQICGYGIVNLQFTSGKTIKLCDVLFVPKLRKNLVSGGCLNSDGFKQVYESDKYILSRFGVFIGFGYFCNRMFRLNVINKLSCGDNSVFCIIFIYIIF